MLFFFSINTKIQSFFTVQDAMNGAGGRTNSKLTQYVTSGTCIGGAKGVENALNPPKATPKAPKATPTLG